MISFDVLCIVFGVSLVKYIYIFYVVDFYDNYEFFGFSWILGMCVVFCCVCVCLKVISVVIYVLVDYVKFIFLIFVLVYVIGNVVCWDLFYLIDKCVSREMFGFFVKVCLIGCVGVFD